MRLRGRAGEVIRHGGGVGGVVVEMRKGGRMG
jgi:hypothetical protein